MILPVEATVSAEPACNAPPTARVVMTPAPAADTVNLSESTAIPPFRFASPAIVAAPEAPITPAVVAVNTLLSLPPTVNVVPSNVKLASSSSAPAVPAIVIRLSVRSLTIALANVASPVVPSVVTLAAAAVLLPRIPSMSVAVMLPAVKSPLLSSTTARLAVPSLAKMLVSVRSTATAGAQPSPAEPVTAIPLPPVTLAT